MLANAISDQKCKTAHISYEYIESVLLSVYILFLGITRLFLVGLVNTKARTSILTALYK